MNLVYEHLTGLHFDHGKRDCYEAMRDFYRDNFGIELDPIARPDKWWEAGQNLYMDHFYEQGFRVIDVPAHLIQPADGFLIAVQSEVPNHAAAYVGNNQILHHFYGRLSEVCEYKGLWRDRTCAVLRHKSLMDYKPVQKDLDLRSVRPGEVLDG